MSQKSQNYKNYKTCHRLLLRICKKNIVKNVGFNIRRISSIPGRVPRNNELFTFSGRDFSIDIFPEQKCRITKITINALLWKVDVAMVRENHKRAREL